MSKKALNFDGLSFYDVLIKNYLKKRRLTVDVVEVENNSVLVFSPMLKKSQNNALGVGELGSLILGESGTSDNA